MKNLLSENMLRFGTKNLSESQKRKLQEQTEGDEQVDDIVTNIINNILQLRPEGADPDTAGVTTIIDRISASITDNLKNLYAVLRDTKNPSDIIKLLDDKMQAMKQMPVSEYLRGSIAGPNSVKTLLGGYYVFGDELSQPYTAPIGLSAQQ